MLYAPSCSIDNVDNNKKDLIVRLFASFDKQGLGWLSSQHAETVGEPFVSARGELLWEITDQWAVLAERNCRPAASWEPCEGRRRNTNKRKRHFDLDATEIKLVALESLVQQNWWDAAPSWCPAWTVIIAAVGELRH